MITAVPAVAAMASYPRADLSDPAAISLAQNESAFPPSRHVLDAGARAVANAALYPDPDWHSLRSAIAAIHPLSEESILCGAGSMELIGCLIRAFAGPGDTVVGSEYGYLYVATAARQAGTTYLRAPERGFRVSCDEMLAKVSPETKIVFLCNPGNPTGTRIPNGDIVGLREALSDRILLVIDQAYGEFDDQDHAPLFALVGRGDTVVTRSLSKAYGLAGARVGWGAFPPAIALEVGKLLNPNNISGVAQAMAAAAVADQAYMRSVVERTAAIRDSFSKQVRDLGLEVPESVTNFVLIRFADADQAKAADGALRHAGLALRGMNGYGLPEALRATIGAPEVMDRVVRVLEQVQESRDAR